MKIRIDRDLCIGAGTCVVLAPDTFDLDDELKAVIRSPELVEGKPGFKGKDSGADIIAAARSCPVLAIFLEDKEGKQIYP
ncbi:MAG: ferredoxin [Candidatus Woykebacteria bacterium]